MYIASTLGELQNQDTRKRACYKPVQAPSLEQMLEFCSDLDGFLSQNPANFAAVHCKVDID